MSTLTGSCFCNVEFIYTFKVSFAHCLECFYFLKAYSIVESMISTAPSTWCTRKTFRTHRPGMYLQGSMLIDLGVISAHVGFLFASRKDHMYKGPRGMFRRHFRSSFAHLVTRNCILTKLHCSTKFGGFPDLPRKKRVGGLAKPLEYIKNIKILSTRVKIFQIIVEQWENISNKSQKGFF